MRFSDYLLRLLHSQCEERIKTARATGYVQGALHQTRRTDLSEFNRFLKAEAARQYRAYQEAHGRVPEVFEQACKDIAFK